MTGFNGASRMARLMYDFTVSRLEAGKYQFNENDISVSKMQEAASYCGRDLQRISSDLSDKISRQKFAAYHAFWFSKIKPIGQVKKTVDGAEDWFEIVDINERIAVQLAFSLVSASVFRNRTDITDLNPAEAAQSTGYQSEPVPIVWRDCKLDCVGECFSTAAKRYCAIHEWQNFEYIVHSLRHRATGPYDLVNVLEATVATACKSVQDNTHPLLKKKEGEGTEARPGD